MDMGQMHDMYQLPMPAAPGVPMSEFNHHFAGAMVFIVGLAALLMYARPRSSTVLRFVWPAALLILGFYLILYSDPGGWPTMAGVSLNQTLRIDPSALQHKVFALLLVLMGLIELARASRIARSRAWSWAFPVLAAFGAIYLLFHKHESPMNMPMNAMPEHALIQGQHILCVGLGMGIAITKVVSDTRILGGKWLPYVWPTLTMLLGLALMLYRE